MRTNRLKRYIVLVFFTMHASLASQLTTTILRGDLDATEPGIAPAALNPFGVWVDAEGNTYIADTSLQRVRVVDANGVASTIAGTGRFGDGGDGGRGTDASLANPTDVAVDRAGSIYIADSHNHRIRKVNPAGKIITYAGTGTRGFGDTARKARFVDLDTPTGLFVDEGRDLYIADQGNHRILRISIEGEVTVLAGTGEAGYSGDGGPATEARLSNPTDIWVDQRGRLTIADRGNHRIRQVGEDGVIRTVAGNGTAGYSGDGHAATSASLRSPWSVSVDAQNRLVIADTGNRAVRIVDQNGLILSIPIPGSDKADPVKPYGVYVHASGALTLADTEHHTILRLEAPSSQLRVTAARLLAPADGITPAEIAVVSSGTSWSSRLLAGEGTIVSTDQGLLVLSSTPGSVVLEISSPGAWPVSLTMQYQAVRSQSSRWDRDDLIANGDDRAVLNSFIDGQSGSEDAVDLRILRPDGTSIEQSLEIQDRTGNFSYSTELAGLHRFEITLPGAEPITSTITVTAPRSWERADPFEPDNSVTQATLRNGSIEGTLHTRSDVDWVLIPVSEGFTTRLDVIADTEITIGNGPSGSVESGTAVFGPSFGLGRGETTLLPISLHSSTGSTAAYRVRATTTRVASFRVEGRSGDFRSDGRDHPVVLLLLDHLGLPDGGDDSTSVRVTIIEGSATIAVLDAVLSGGRLPIAIKADRPGDVVLEIRGSGIPVSTISLRARSGVRLDLDPTRGDQAARRVTRQVGQELTVDLYSDADPTPAMGVHYRVAYDSDALAFIRIDPTPSLLEAESLVFYENGVVDVSTVFLEGEFELGDGWIGRLVFRLVAEVASAAVTIEEASIGYADRRIESYLIGADGAGSVMVEAKLSFLRLAEVFGLDESDPGFDPRYDLNGDGQISYSDFLDFAARQSP